MKYEAGEDVVFNDCAAKRQDADNCRNLECFKSRKQK